MPLWLAALVVLMALGAGAMFVRWYFKSEQIATVTIPGANKPGGGTVGPGGPRVNVRPRPGGPRNFQPPPPELVNQITSSNWSVRSPTLSMFIHEVKPGQYTLTFNFAVRTGPDDDFTLIRTVFTAVNNPKSPAAVGANLTDDQRAKLKPLVATQPPPVTADDRTKLTNDFNSWRTATDPAVRTAAGNTIVADLTAAGNTAFTAAKAAHQDRMTQIHSILSADQITALLNPKPITAQPKPAPAAPTPKPPVVAPRPATVPATAPAT
jgi:hypothetical protein